MRLLYRFSQNDLVFHGLAFAPVLFCLDLFKGYDKHPRVSSSQFKFSQKILKAGERIVKFVCSARNKEDELTHSQDCGTFRATPFTLVCLALSIVYNITHL